MLVILRILFSVQTPVVTSWGPDPRKPVINPLWDCDYFNIEIYSYKEAKDNKRQKFGWV
jgi:hypothetical protein